MYNVEILVIKICVENTFLEQSYLSGTIKINILPLKINILFIENFSIVHL